jgi:uncharacterized membrane protein YcaP (DUF421 family)
MLNWQQLLIGDAPWPFLIEVLWRAGVMYVLLLVFMRLMGKRFAAQLTTNELAVVLMLGAAIGVPIQVVTQGILPAVIVLAITTGLQRGLAWLSFKNRKLEALAQGDVSMLVQDGRYLLDKLNDLRLSREMLASELRALNVQHLGELRRVYVEASGGLSLVKFREPRPGLSLSPDTGGANDDHLQLPDLRACWRCGHVEAPTEKGLGACVFCGCDQWRAAVRKAVAPTRQTSTDDDAHDDANADTQSDTKADRRKLA